MGLNNLKKNQLANLFTNEELRNLIRKDKNKMRKVIDMSKNNKPKSKNNLIPCYLYPNNPDCNNTGMDPGR